MAITQGVGPHNGWVDVGGQRFTVYSGNVHETSLNTNSTLRARLPLNAPGYLETFAGLKGSDTDVNCYVQAHGSEANLFKGKLVKVEFQLVQGWIDVTGDNGHQELNDHKTTDSWTNKKGNEIAQDLVSRLGIPFMGSASKVMVGKKIGQDYVSLTDNISYMLKIHKLADFDGVRAFIDRNGTFRYQKPGQGGDYQVTWTRSGGQAPKITSDCLDLNIIFNLPAGDTWNGNQTSYQTDQKQNSTANATVQGGSKQRQYYADTPPNQTQEQNYQRLQSALDAQAQHAFQLQCTVVGDPSIDATKQIVLSGSQFFDDSYPIDTVDHYFGMSGYTSQVNSKTAGKGRSAQ